MKSSKYCFTINFCDHNPIQVIFRLYRTKSEILHGFDIASSGVGFDDQNVILTSLSQFSYEYNCNIVN